MNTSLKVLEAEVLPLVPADHSRMLERLIASFDSDPAVEEASGARSELKAVAYSEDWGECRSPRYQACMVALMGEVAKATISIRR